MWKPNPRDREESRADSVGSVDDYWGSGEDSNIIPATPGTLGTNAGGYKNNNGGSVEDYNLTLVILEARGTTTGASRKTLT